MCRGIERDEIPNTDATHTIIFRREVNRAYGVCEEWESVFFEIALGKVLAQRASVFFEAFPQDFTEESAREPFDLDIDRNDSADVFAGMFSVESAGVRTHASRAGNGVPSDLRMDDLEAPHVSFRDTGDDDLRAGDETFVHASGGVKPFQRKGAALVRGAHFHHAAALAAHRDLAAGDDFDGDGSRDAFLKFRDAEEFRAIFVSAWKKMQQIANRIDLAAIENSAQARAHALDVLNGSIKAVCGLGVTRT